MSSGTSRISFNTMPLFFSRSSSFSWSAAKAGEERTGRATNKMLIRYAISFFISFLQVSDFQATHVAFLETERPVPTASLTGEAPPAVSFCIDHRKNSARRYFFASGGKCVNIFCTPLSRFFVFLSALLESVSLDEPRQSKFLLLASNRSTTREPT